MVRHHQHHSVVSSPLGRIRISVGERHARGPGVNDSGREVLIDDLSVGPQPLVVNRCRVGGGTGIDGERGRETTDTRSPSDPPDRTGRGRKL